MHVFFFPWNLIDLMVTIPFTESLYLSLSIVDPLTNLQKIDSIKISRVVKKLIIVFGIIFIRLIIIPSILNILY